MNEKDKRQEALFDIILSDDVWYRQWRSFRYKNSHRFPLYPGSAIRDMAIVVMEEFLSLDEIELNYDQRQYVYEE